MEEFMNLLPIIVIGLLSFFIGKHFGKLSQNKKPIQKIVSANRLDSYSSIEK